MVFYFFTNYCMCLTVQQIMNGNQGQAKTVASSSKAGSSTGNSSSAGSSRTNGHSTGAIKKTPSKTSSKVAKKSSKSTDPDKPTVSK
jgi:hypothetical protein